MILDCSELFCVIGAFNKDLGRVLASVASFFACFCWLLPCFALLGLALPWFAWLYLALPCFTLLGLTLLMRFPFHCYSGFCARGEHRIKTHAHAKVKPMRKE